jgi:hypothetical protein
VVPGVAAPAGVIRRAAARGPAWAGLAASVRAKPAVARALAAAKPAERGTELRLSAAEPWVGLVVSAVVLAVLPVSDGTVAASAASVAAPRSIPLPGVIRWLC